jgi:uncharacterized membrane protein (TIGR02234 family)
VSSKRTLGLASVLLVLAAAATFGAGRLVWVEVGVQDLLQPARTLDLTGAQWAWSLNVVPAVLLAAVPAALALTRVWRILVAAIAAIAGLVAAFPAIGVITGDKALDQAKVKVEPSLRAADLITDVHGQHAGPLLAVLGAVCAVLGAVLLIRNARAGGMGSRYASPAVRRAELERRVFSARTESDPDAEVRSERDMWDVLDGGADPTEQGTGPTSTAEHAPGPEAPRGAV